MGFNSGFKGLNICTAMPDDGSLHLNM